MSEEVWKVIEEFPNYSISNIGRVRNSRTQRILKTTTRCDYLRVSLWKNNKGVSKDIHRLLALAFILNPENKKQVDHINRNRIDNRLENLRWVSPSENISNTSFTKRNILKEKFISVSGKYYIVAKQTDQTTLRNTFETLEEAIEFRNGLEEFYS